VRRARPAALAATERVLAQQVVVAGVVTIVFLSQVIFYNGQFPSFGGRYDFPGRTTEIIVYASLIVGAGTLAGVLGWPRGLARAAFASAIALRALASGFHVHDTAVLYVDRTTKMRDAVATVLARASGDSTPVVMFSTDPNDYEAAMLVGALLQTMHVANPVFLATPRYTPRQLRDPFLSAVGDLLQLSARDGDARFHLRPNSELAGALARAGGKCVALQLHGYEPFEPWPCGVNTLEGQP
jgi:hypothetical protein